MQRVEEPMETIHLYVVREEEKRPYSLLPLFFAFLCLLFLVALTLYSGEHPSYEQKTLHVPVILLPLKTFTTSVKVIPTGKKNIIATRAQGLLTLYNGSIFIQYIPKGVILIASNGVEVVTDTDVYVPAGSFNGYGFATVSAHAVVAGKNGNIPVDAINRVEGSSIYIRNLQPFSGGQDAYSVTFPTPQDRLRAIEQARKVLSPHTLSGLLLTPCRETIAGNVTLTWQCQFVTYHVPSYMRVTGVRLIGKNLFVDVIFLEHPKQFVTK